jgi:hypothetical protein
VGPVLRIRRALDGMPLAFELAAAPGCARSPAGDRSAAGRPLPAARRFVSGTPAREARSAAKMHRKASGFRPTRTPRVAKRVESQHSHRATSSMRVQMTRG